MAAATAIVKAITPPRQGKIKRIATKRTTLRPLLEDGRNYSIAEGAAAAGVSAITFWRAIAAGHLQTYRAGRRRIVSGEHVKAWLEAGGKTGNVKKEVTA